MDEFFYGTLPQDTQDFSQVLRGVRRSIGDIGRGVSYYPYDLVGAPVDLINMALTPVGLGSERPVLGSDYLRNIAQSLGLAQPSTGSGAETAGRFGAAFVNPAAGARAVGQASQAVTRGANLSADRLVQMITGNPQATAPRVLEETSMPFMQAMAPKTPAVPGLMEPTKSDIGFYSQLEAATIPLQNKGTGDQYLAQIQKSAGVKPEEIQWTGLDEFLKGKKSVTKAEIQDYLNANRVDVREVRLGTPQALEVRNQQIAEKYGYQAEFDNGEIAFFDPRLDDYVEFRDLPVEMRTEISNPQMQFGGTTKFSQYTLPGGENYREILLTLPQKQIEFSTQGWYAKPQGSYAWLVFDERGNQIGTAYDAKNVQDAVREVAKMQGATPIDKNFRSGHFDQPNILAHMRVNDRVVDGKKTLFIEEIQSDWHQAGRKRGYKSEALGEKVSDEEYRRAAALQRRRDILGETLTAEELADFNDIMGRHTRSVPAAQVPDAPFKTSWHELTLKRAIQEASEKGYDQIAFTTGKTQAERYDLSNRIKTIIYGQPDASGRRSVTAITPDGDRILGDRYTMSEIEDQIGKEMAEKMDKSAGEFDSRTGTYALSGLDLKTEHKGMKGFYDNILPKSLEKLGKKFDAKVGKTEMDGVEVWQMDITPKMRESVTTKGQPLFAVPAVGAGLLGAGMYQDEQMF